MNKGLDRCHSEARDLGQETLNAREAPDEVEGPESTESCEERTHLSQDCTARPRLGPRPSDGPVSRPLPLVPRGRSRLQPERMAGVETAARRRHHGG